MIVLFDSDIRRKHLPTNPEFCRLTLELCVMFSQSFIELSDRSRYPSETLPQLLSSTMTDTERHQQSVDLSLSGQTSGAVIM